MLNTISKDGISTKKDVAAYLHCSERTVDNLIANGVLDSVKIGRMRRVKNRSLLNLAEQGTKAA